jgi:hypothetical protein
MQVQNISLSKYIPAARSSPPDEKVSESYHLAVTTGMDKKSCNAYSYHSEVGISYSASLHLSLY